MESLNDTLKGYRSDIVKFGGNSIKSNVYSWRTSYGSKLIDVRQNDKKYFWKIKIDKYESDNGIMIGFHGDSCGDYSKAYWVTDCDPGYAYAYSGNVYENRTKAGSFKSIAQGDIVEILLNCKTKELEFLLNQKSVVILHNIKDDKYKLAISLAGYGAQCTLLDSKVSRNDSEEKKDVDQDKISELELELVKKISLIQTYEQSIKEKDSKLQQFQAVKFILFDQDTYKQNNYYIQSIEKYEQDMNLEKNKYIQLQNEKSEKENKAALKSRTKIC